MAHTHHDEVVVERDHGFGPATGMIVAIGALIVFAVIALAVLWSAPWDDDGGVDTSPGISDQIGGGDGSGDGGGGTGDGGSGGGTGGDGGTGGGGAPAPAQ